MPNPINGLGSSPILTKYGRTLALNVLFGLTASPPAQLYAALSTTAPLWDGTNWTELSGSGYTRVAVPGWTAAVVGTSYSPTGATDVVAWSNITSDILFPNPTAPWAVPVALAYFDAPTGGNMVWIIKNTGVNFQHPTPGHALLLTAYDGLGKPQFWVGLDISTEIGDLENTYGTIPFFSDYPSNMDIYRFPDAYQMGVLDKLTGRSLGWTPPTYYLGILQESTNAEPDSAGFTLVDSFDSSNHWPGDPAYARSVADPGSLLEAVNFSSLQNDTAWSWTVGISPPSPTFGWTRIGDQRDYRAAVWDAPSGGTRILFLPLGSGGNWPVTVFPGDTVDIPAGNWVVRVS